MIHSPVIFLHISLYSGCWRGVPFLLQEGFKYHVWLWYRLDVQFPYPTCWVQMTYSQSIGMWSHLSTQYRTIPLVLHTASHSHAQCTLWSLLHVPNTWAVWRTHAYACDWHLHALVDWLTQRTAVLSALGSHLKQAWLTVRSCFECVVGCGWQAGLSF